MHFHASEFMSRLTFAPLLVGNCVCSFLLVKWREFFLCVCVDIDIDTDMRDKSQMASLRPKKVSDLTLQIKCFMCAAQGFDD